MGKSIHDFNFQEGEILLFDKELEWTSFDLVQKVRNNLCRALGVKKLKVGHAGTLDPKATGLMILCTGKATKQIESLQSEEKEYIASLKLGATTPSFDLENEEDVIYPTSHITRELVLEALQKFEGITDQVPPLFSAIKVDGKRAYKHARKGEEIELKARQIFIREIELQQFSTEEIIIRVICSKGTYIRALARDLGQSLNSGAYLTALRRTRIGNFSVENAFLMENFLKILKGNVTN
ncbi:MAG: tRNA pseudouridine(55) synthase TruB [Prolixibacteraceae bacterium]|jgi:tRNA pseudouridine55 synthase|nr:tRNA pseudouridine(55) synthase TruB [Prolixibacteraceae bacterium]